jgi:hypothetical protein
LVMPRRSNPFQQLVYVLKRELESSAKVTESAMLPDPHTGSNREVDVLIERDWEGTPFQVGVECRDHSNVKQDVIWIESVVTKHRDLGLNASIVVSSTGFTKGAELKAKAHGIKTISLEKGSETDWANTFFAELDTLFWGEVTSTIQSITALTTSGATGLIPAEAHALDAQGRPIIEMLPFITQALGKVGMVQQVTPGKVGTALFEIKPENVFLKDVAGTLQQIAKFSVELKWTAPLRTPITLRKGRLELSPVAFGKGVASGEQDAIAKEVELFIMNTGEEQPIAIANVLDSQGQIQEIRLTPEAWEKSDTGDED